MELLYLYYHPAKKAARYILLLHLGERNGKICGITTEAVSDGERRRIAHSAPVLSQLSLERRLEWLRTHCPVAFRNGYREIHARNATTISRHPINASRI